MKKREELMRRTSPVEWQARPVQDVLEELDTIETGLSPEEAHERLADLGANLIKPPKRGGPIQNRPPLLPLGPSRTNLALSV